MKNRNFIAKYNWQINKAKTFKDKKKALKRGYAKYRSAPYK